MLSSDVSPVPVLPLLPLYSYLWIVNDPFSDVSIVAAVIFGVFVSSAANAVADMLPSIIAPARRPARSFLNFFILVSSLSLSSFPFSFFFLRYLWIVSCIARHNPGIIYLNHLFASSSGQEVLPSFLRFCNNRYMITAVPAMIAPVKPRISLLQLPVAGSWNFA